MPKLRIYIHRTYATLYPDGEQVTVDGDNIIEVPLTNTTMDGSIYRSNGAIVPFLVEGVGGGNTAEEFIALFMPIKPDDQLLARIIRQG